MTQRSIPPADITEQDSWRPDAACAWAIADNRDLAAAWDSEDHTYAFIARTICMTCPVRRECILDAVRDPEAEGLRGGIMFTSGGVSTMDGAMIRREFGVRARTRVKNGRYRFVDFDVVPHASPAELC